MFPINYLSVPSSSFPPANLPKEERCQLLVSSWEFWKEIKIFRRGVEARCEEEPDEWVQDWGWGRATSARTTFFWWPAFGVEEVRWPKALGWVNIQWLRRREAVTQHIGFPAVSSSLHLGRAPGLGRSSFSLHLLPPLAYFLAGLFTAHAGSLQLLLYSFPLQWEDKSLRTETTITCLLNKILDGFFPSLSASEEERFLQVPGEALSPRVWEDPASSTFA